MAGETRENLRKAIDACDGLVGIGDMARRWGVSDTRARQNTKHPTFPPPVATINNGRQDVWGWDEVRGWREERMLVHGSDGS